MSCIALTKKGSVCRANSLAGEKLCLFHSSSENAQKARAKRDPRRILPNDELVVILQQELRKARRIKNDELRTGEVRRIIELIYQLKGERPTGNNKKSSFEEAIKKCKSEQK